MIPRAALASLTGFASTMTFWPDGRPFTASWQAARSSATGSVTDLGANSAGGLGSTSTVSITRGPGSSGQVGGAR